jgi:hypothetical protein
VFPGVSRVSLACFFVSLAVSRVLSAVSRVSPPVFRVFPAVYRVSRVLSAVIWQVHVSPPVFPVSLLCVSVSIKLKMRCARVQERLHERVRVRVRVRVQQRATTTNNNNEQQQRSTTTTKTTTSTNNEQQGTVYSKHAVRGACMCSLTGTLSTTTVVVAFQTFKDLEGSAAAARVYCCMHICSGTSGGGNS